jgi:hypothetical protein
MDRLRKEGAALVYRCANIPGARYTSSTANHSPEHQTLVVNLAAPGTWAGKSSVSGGLMALPRCDTWPHVVKTPIRRIGMPPSWNMRKQLSIQE